MRNQSTFSIARQSWIDALLTPLAALTGNKSMIVIISVEAGTGDVRVEDFNIVNVERYK